MDVNAIIDRYLSLRSTRTGVASATGYQLDRLREGMSLGSYHNAGAQEEFRIYYAHLAYVFESLLDDEQRIILFALRTPCDWKTYERVIRDGDLHLTVRANPDGTEDRTQETHAGERFLRAARDATGDPVDGCSVVLGTKPVYPTREQVAARLGKTFAEVKRAVRLAYATIRASQQYDALQEEAR